MALFQIHHQCMFLLVQTLPEDNSRVEDAEAQNNRHIKRRKVLTNEERLAVYRVLLQNVVYGRLKRGVISMLASTYSVCKKTIQRIWKQSKNTGDVRNRKTRNCGRKRVQLDTTLVQQIPLAKRTTLRSMATALKTSKSALHRLFKIGVLRCHFNTIRPLLKEENKIARLKFCFNMLESAKLTHDPTFKGMYNVVHIDEKWFYMTKKIEKYYLLLDEEEPYRTCKSKNFIPKVMFLAAMARPRDLETKPITSVRKKEMRSFLIEKVLPAIKEKWPRGALDGPIFIQQDNARTHVDIDDPEFCQAAAQDGFDIRLTYQPPNSPDLNVLDLGYFAAIQSLQQKERARNVDDLVTIVVKSFEDFPTDISDRIFLTLQTCMIEIMKKRGANSAGPNIAGANLAGANSAGANSASSISAGANSGLQSLDVLLH
ncbi:hypothetical protein COLO4_20032 [Corchorus olitorius]|uniref:DUF7769 domain-containing protein n=1 Tax=Corchorus olitorius TaxID=93759 RepID=A0A1R3J267_9ROSI|nr:hypothetical protein COLO4_20032 [Corchorus olitorius]